jgi:hypothetical protein
LVKIIRLADYCCHGGSKILDRDDFTPDHLLLAREGNRELIFSPLGNLAHTPKLALVGITPGAQSEKFAEMLRFCDVEHAARKAAFAGAQAVIKQLLNAHGFLKALKIECPNDLNDSAQIFTTSLVKCCLKVDGSYNYAAPDIAASRVAMHCVLNRFVRDIDMLSSLTHVVIFGEA